MGIQDQATSVVDLINAIDSRLRKVHTQSLDLSFNELLDMRKHSELDISPDYQRLFQWSEGARSRFVESLLLEMPVPPIYVIEEEDGKYLLIDGLQRISSYLHLRGELKASSNLQCIPEKNWCCLTVTLWSSMERHTMIWVLRFK